MKYVQCLTINISSLALAALLICALPSERALQDFTYQGCFRVPDYSQIRLVCGRELVASSELHASHRTAAATDSDHLAGNMEQSTGTCQLPDIPAAALEVCVYEKSNPG